MPDVYDWGWPMDRPLPVVDPGHPEHETARVIVAAGATCRVASALGEHWAEMSGLLAHHRAGTAGKPVVGDWVVIQSLESTDRAVIHHLLPRQGVIERLQVDQDRRETSAGIRQVLAANVDKALVLAALDRPLNPRRIERFMTMAYNGGVTPLVVLTKADRHPDPDQAAASVQAASPGADVLMVSIFHQDSLDRLSTRMASGRTHVLLGPSGAGKSTLINRLAGQDIQTIGPVRKRDAKGRHTTTARELFRLPSGALVIDTPGLRAVGLAGEGEGLGQVFQDIMALALNCRFRDCRHQGEPGCAVEAAVRSGSLDPERLRGFRKLRKEAEYEIRRADPVARKKEHKRFARLTKEVKKMDKRRN
ncbi:MAG: ribosome small subunit-dependent GTPase A [Thermodesulfobacteriota bacterium]